jgi:phage-related protein
VQAGWDLLLAFLGGIRDNIGELASTAIGIVTEFINAMATGIPEYVRAMVNLFTTVLTTMAYELGLLITTLAPDIGTALLDGILTGLSQSGGKILEFFTKWVGEVIDWVKSLFGIKSPSTEFLSIGVDLIQGLINGITDTVHLVIDFFTGLIGDILGWLGDALNALVDKGVDFITGLWNGINSTIGIVSGFFRGLMDDVKGWIGNTLSTLFSKGMDLLTGLWNGIKAIRDTVMNYFTNFGTMVKGWMSGAIDWLVETGENVVRGLWNGISAMGGWLWEKVTNFVKDMVMSPVDLVLSVFSPSRWAMGRGKYIVEGLMIGIESMATPLSKASAGMGHNIIDSFAVDPKELTNPIQAAIETAVDMLGDLDSLNPTITPILDLSDVQKDAKKINDLFDTSVASGYNKASALATQANQTSSGDTSKPTTSEVKFEQNIYAPSALSTNDIYRQTRSQIAIAKEELSIP